MSDFEEKAYLSGYYDSEEYLNHLLDNQDISYYNDENDDEEFDDSDNDILFVVSEKNIQKMAENILNSLYWDYDYLKPLEYVCRYTYQNQVLFIEAVQNELIDKLDWLDIEGRKLFDYFDIRIEIDSYYCSAEIKGIILDK